MARFKIAHLARRGGTYYFRAPVPRVLVEKFGCREIKLSLQTRDPQTARVRCRACSSAFERLLAGVRGMPDLTQDQIAKLVRGYLERELSRSVEAAFLLPKDATTDLDEQIEHYEAALVDMRERLAYQIFDPACRSEVRALITQVGLAEADLDGAQVGLICAGVLRAQIENFRVIAAMLQGRYDEAVPRDPLFKGIEVPPIPLLPGMASAGPDQTVSGLAEKYVGLKAAHAWVPKTRKDNERVLEWFKEIAGPEKPIKAVTVDDVRLFRDVLLRLPANYTKSKEHAGKSLMQVAEAGSASQRLAIKTARKYFENLKTFLKWCVEEGYLDKVPGQALKLAAKTNPLEARLPFSTQQLTTLFQSPQYTGHLSPTSRAKPGNMSVRDGKYWIPLLGLFTGMRLGEIVQLQCADIKHEGDVWFFDVSRTEGDGKQLKTASSQRKVPIHPTLVALGFLELVAKAMQSRPKGRLFADIDPGADGYFSHNFSKYFSRYAKAIGMKTEKTAFHSFRHNFKDALVRANVADSRIKALLGHADGSVTAAYGSKLTPAVLIEDLSKVKFEVDFSSLLPPTKP